MLRLRKILLYDSLYLFILGVALVYLLLNLNNYSFNDKVNSTNGYIDKIEVQGDYLKLLIKTNKGMIIGNYYFDTLEEKNIFLKEYHYGDNINIDGENTSFRNSTIPNGFNYIKYLKSRNIKASININNYYKINDNKNIIYYIKDNLYNHFDTYKSSTYLKAFILGDTSLIEDDVSRSYQDIGISHLLAISGGNIAFLAMIILFILKRLKIEEDRRYKITCFLLFIYLLIVGLNPSVFRAVLFFIFLAINKIYYFNIKTINIFILVLIIVIFNNLFIIYDLGFQFSFFISFFLIKSQDYLAIKNPFISIYRVSMISFIASFPIVVSNFNQINLLSIIYNLIFVPVVSVFIFPMSIIVSFIPFLDNIYLIIIRLMEDISLFLSTIKIFKIVLVHNYYFIFIYYLLSFIVIYTINKKSYKYFILLVLIVLFHSNYNNIFKSTYIIYIDVGTGDSILIYSNNKTILIDTGGKVNRVSESWKKRDVSGIYYSKIKPLLASLGISKLDYLLITHGDYDHMGEAINLVEDFKVGKVIFNCGTYNNLENELIKILENKKIRYNSCINELNFSKKKLYFLNTKEYSDENNNSNVVYMKINNYKFLFMGDAGINREIDILEKYSLDNIDFLKVGHHGSDTSSSEEFIDKIKPKYSLISVGKNNRYGHPKKSILDILGNSNIYRTDLDGSIKIKLNKNGYIVKTCVPYNE